MAKIDEDLETQLAQNRDIYASLLEDRNVRDVAYLDGISEEQAREKIRKDQLESEQEIRQQFQLERDGEYARMLQAQQYESSDDEYNFDRRQQTNSMGYVTPSSTFSGGRTLPLPSFNLPDRTHYSGPSNGFSNLGELSRSGFDFSSNPPKPRPTDSRGLYVPAANFDRPDTMPWMVPPGSTMKGFNEDDDLQEITPDVFNSRFGKLPQLGSGRSFLTGPTPMPGRVLPWIQDPDPRAREFYMRDPYMRDPKAVDKAMDLVREQMELDMDEDDFKYLFPHPHPFTEY
jgi:hypothetical protein